MKHTTLIFSAMIALGLSTASCQGNGGASSSASSMEQAPYPHAPNPTPDNNIEPMQVERLDLFTYNYKAGQDDGRLESMQPGIGLYLALMGKDPNNLSQGVGELSQTQAVKVFGADVEKLMPEVDANLGKELGQIASVLAAQYPAAKISRVYAIVAPYRQGVVISDSVAMVVTNLYLGPDYQGYQGFDDYFRSTRTPSRIQYDVAEAALAAAYPYQQPEQGSQPTVLSKMLYQGALLYCTMSTMSAPSPAMAIGVTDPQLEWLVKNQKEIWRALVDRKLLYSTVPLDADKLLAPAGTSPWLHPEAPGRVGRFVGLEIVRAYMAKHPNTSPVYLLSPKFYNGQNTLVESGYNP